MCNDIKDNVDKQLVFLNNDWDKLFTSKGANNSAQNILNHITDTLYNIRCDSYPYYHVYSYYSNSGVIDVNSSQVDSYDSYNSILKQINLLIWAIAKHDINDFGLFIAEWNYAMSLERNHANIHNILKSVIKYLDSTPYCKKSVVDADDYNDVNSILRDCANEICPYSYDEKDILHSIINHSWHKFINNNFTSTIKDNASKIANNGSNNINVINYLKHFNIISGKELQKHLVSGISYNNNFNSTRGFGIAISKITNPNAMFYFDKANPWNIHKISGRELVKMINKKQNAKKHYQKLVNKQNKIHSQVKAMKNKYNF